MRIGIIAPPWVAVPPRDYGGTETVIDQQARGLVAAGHEVELFATGDSTCPVPTSWLYAEALGTNALKTLEVAHAQAAYEHLADVDLVHDHTVLGPLHARRWRPGLPVVATNHGVFDEAMTAHYRAVAEEVPLIAISDAQRRTAPSVRVAAVIHHGIDVSTVPLGAGRGGYLLFLGRMSPTKGVHRAIAVARATGRRLVIAAKMWEPDEHRYFAEEVEPRLGDDVVYLGEVSGADKFELLAGAEALLNPIRWPEPFGLVMIEAMACGTPVLAFPEGAAAEIVEDGRTGFLCRDEREMEARVDDLAGIDRSACRARVAERFSVDRFVDRHVRLYRSLIAARSDLVS